MTWTEFIVLVPLGLIAGALGGMLGIGGSIVMIPVLTLVLGHDQHLSQAAAMIINVFVAVPAVVRHHRAGAVDWLVFRRALPAGLVLILAGVAVSNRIDGARLMVLFGIFLLYVIFANARKLLGKGPEPEAGVIHRGWVADSTVGGITGFAAGLLGIGGGIIAVPLLQTLCHLRLRRCIGSSVALMCVTAAIGATYKNLALSNLNGANGALDPLDSLLIAGCLAPTAIIGGFLGAHLTHTLPLLWIRLALLVLLCFAAGKFLGLY